MYWYSLCVRVCVRTYALLIPRHFQQPGAVAEPGSQTTAGTNVAFAPYCRFSPAFAPIDFHVVFVQKIYAVGFVGRYF